MKIETCFITDIQFKHVAYPSSLKESLLRMGQGFAVHVKQSERQFICVDGHKRLSAITDILKTQPDHPLQSIKILIMNGARTASGTAKNHH